MARKVVPLVQDSFFENGVVSIIEIGPDFSVVRANSVFCGMVGFPEAELRAITWSDMVHGQDLAFLRDQCALAAATGEPDISCEVRLHKKHGGYIPVLLNVRPLPNAPGHLAVFVTDLSNLRRAEQRLESAVRHEALFEMGIGSALGYAVEARDPYTAGHQDNVSVWAEKIAKRLDVDQNQLDGAVAASIVHDVGKLGVPGEYLTKPTRLTDLEMHVIKTHPLLGYTILKELPTRLPVAEIVYQHHERCDGSGYPRGLKKDDILIEAFIVSAADIIDALIRPRSYRTAMNSEVVVSLLREQSGIGLPADVSDAAIHVLMESPDVLLESP